MSLPRSRSQCPRAVPPAPAPPRAAAAPLLCPAVRGPGALVGAPPEQLRPTGGTGAPLPPGTGSTGRSQPVTTGDPAQATPGAAGISQARLMGAGPRNPPLAAAAPFPLEIPQGPFVLPSESVLGSDIGPGNPEHLVPISRCPRAVRCSSPREQLCDLARAACGCQPPARAEAVTVAGEAAAAVCPVRNRGSVGSVGDGLAVP